MFDFFQAVFAKVASFVVGVIMATGLVSPPTVQTQATSTEPVAQIEIQEESATSTQLLSEIESLKKEAEQARTEADAERLKAEKAKAEATAAQAKIEQQVTKQQNYQSSPSQTSNTSASPENFSESYVAFALGEAESWFDLAEFADLATDYVNERLNSISLVRDKNRAYASGYGDPTMTQAANLWGHYYQNDINAMQSYKDRFVTIAKVARDQADSWKNAARNAATSYVSRQQFIDAVEETMQEDQNGKILDTIKKNIDFYNSYVEKTEYEREVFFAKIDGLLDAAASTAASSMQATNSQVTDYDIPAIQLPQTTRCTISGAGGMGLEAYVTCTTSSF